MDKVIQMYDIKRFEYTIRYLKNDKNKIQQENELNNLGNEGWELVSAFYSQSQDSIECIFKRKKEA